ncbi:MAG: hypothetical protein AAF721_11370 [Myxococcota bacterium]
MHERRPVPPRRASARFSQIAAGLLSGVLALATTSGAGAAPKPRIRSKGSRTTNGNFKTAKPKYVKKAKYNLAVQFVRLADDDGSNASTLTQAKAQAELDVANEIWRRNGGDIRFEIHPASNFGGLVKSTLLNHDCILAPGQTAATIAANKDPDLNDDGEDGTAADAELLCHKKATKAERMAYGLARADRIVVFARRGYEKVKWNADKGNWELTTPSGGSSSAVASYINMPSGFGGGTLFAHEVGHYLHLLHTHGKKPTSLAEARDDIEAWIAKNPGKDPAETFNGDANAGGSAAASRVFDTPPDPTGKLWHNVFGERCNPDDHTLLIPYAAGGTTKNAVLRPARHNVMSYFKSCTNLTQRLSTEQLNLARRALNVGNRQSLWKTKASKCFKGGASVGTSVDTEAKLANAVRNVVACHLLQKEVWPWETVMGNVYRNPADVRTGFVRRGRVAVQPARERALLDKLLNTPMLD